MEWSLRHARAKVSLANWVRVVKLSRWNTLVDIRATFPSADQVSVGSGRSVIIFNIAGNQYRLVCAVHFRTKMVFALKFMTHSEYDKMSWKNEL